MGHDSDRWNHNIQYHPVILRAVGPDVRHALDVGCGEGILARELRTRVPKVTGIDLDEPSLGLARGRAIDGVDYVHGDFLTHPFEPDSFDFIGCVTALHHMDERAALERMRDLLRPGGALGVVGVARRRWPADLPMDIAASVVTRLHKLTKAEWTTPAPKVWPPPSTFGQLRRLTARVLPGASFRRRVLWRYTITWTKPTLMDGVDG